MIEVRSFLKPPTSRSFVIIAGEGVDKIMVEKIVASVFDSLSIDADVEGIDNAMTMRSFGGDNKVLSGCTVRITEKDLAKLNEGRIRIFSEATL